MQTTRLLRVYTDGASRSNPGHAACAFLVMEQDNRPFKMHSEYLGPEVTNNVAEYYGLARALVFLTEFTSGHPALGYRAGPLGHSLRVGCVPGSHDDHDSEAYGHIAGIPYRWP